MNTKKKDGLTMMLVALAIGTFMSALDTSAVTVATPSIKAALGVSLSAVEWVITGYLLVISSLLLTFGRLADMYGHRRIYTIGFSVFTAGSLLCGLAPDVAALVAFRVVQALGAAMMFSSSSAIITANAPAEKRGKAFGIIAIAVAAACCVGPVVGGVLVTSLGWRSIFFINVPIGVVGTAFALRFIPADGPKSPAKFDLPGSVLAFAALFLVLLPLDLSASDGFPLPVFLALLASGLVLTAAFILRERSAAQPMLNLSLFRNRVFSASLTATMFNFAAQFMMGFLAPYYFQSVRHMTPLLTGLLYLPMPIATIVVAPLSGSYSDRHDSRLLAAGGMAAMALGIGALSFLSVDTPYWYIVAAMIITGAGSGMFQSPNNSAIMGSVPAQFRGAASGTLATMRNVGMVLGVALSGAIFNRANARALATLSAGSLSGADLAREAATRGLQVTFVVAACSALVAMIASLQKGKTR
jgi:EmrB/QacA subfamily drug resistance transporter